MSRVNKTKDCKPYKNSKDQMSIDVFNTTFTNI
uniref:Uncharacterized protein n=1 Tax=Arundo donax TaxID=35708 RepID=A0A0A8ZG81_ARUDO